MNSATLLFFWALCLMGSALSLKQLKKSMRSKRGISMASSANANFAGAAKQALDIPALTSMPTKTTVNGAATMSKRAVKGAGFDQRSEIDSEEDINETISAIDRSYRQHSLLMGLQGESWGEAEKLERIRLAAIQEGLIDSKVMPAASAHASALKSAGLFDEWEFNF